MANYRVLLHIKGLLAVTTAISFALPSFAAEGAAFPNLNSERFCRAKAAEAVPEKQRAAAFLACVTHERWLKTLSEPYWYLVPAKVQRIVVNNELKESRPQTYSGVLSAVYSAVGTACILTRELSCQGSKNITSHGNSLPKIDSEPYCTSSVSKMLNADEKRVEFDKCLSQESAVRDGAAPFWEMLPAESQEKIIVAAGGPKPSAYARLARYISDWVARACIVTRELSCQKRNANQP